MHRAVGALAACAAAPVPIRGAVSVRERARRGLVCARGVDRREGDVQLGREVLAIERPAALDALHFLAAPVRDLSAREK